MLKTLYARINIPLLALGLSSRKEVCPQFFSGSQNSEKSWGPDQNFQKKQIFWLPDLPDHAQETFTEVCG